MGTLSLAIFLVLSFCDSHENSEDCVGPDPTPPSPVLTLFADVLFHRHSNSRTTRTFALL